MLSDDPIVAYKGFTRDFTCRDFQYRVGEAYEHKGEVKACESGFHACEHPLEVFGYYPPGRSRFAEVTLSGELSRGEDSKIAASRITIVAELQLHELIERAVKHVFDRAKPPQNTATGYGGAATAAGNYGAATAAGNYGAASATGNFGTASATGYGGAAIATGHCGGALATGHYGAAIATGRNGRASGEVGCALFLVERAEDGKIVNVWAGIVGRDGIKPDVFYTLRDGKPVACRECLK